MGKSNKKIKNDRINTLRKQYDAFLEEDKKRRERNEYILGKLDKMRSSTALVPISKVNYQLDQNPPEVYMRSDNGRTKSSVFDNAMCRVGEHKIPSSILTGHTDETTILKEISKKYILIPKRTPPLENELTYRKDALDDNDWKSKYNILDDLKRQEKEGRPVAVLHQNNATVCSSQKDSESNTTDKQTPDTDVDSNQKRVPIEHTNLTDVNQLNTCVEEEKEKGNENTSTKNPEIVRQVSEEYNIPLQNESILTNESSKTSEPIYSTEKTDNINEIYQHQKIDDKMEKENFSDSNKNNNNQITQNMNNEPYVNGEIVGNEMYYQEGANQANYDNLIPEKTEYTGFENVSNASFINSEQMSYGEKLQDPKPVELLKENLNINENPETAHNVSVTQDLKSINQVESYDNTVSNPGHDTESNQSSHDTAQHYQSTQESISAVLDNIEHMEPVNHDSEINAFETEQKEMFYSEQTGDEAYGYSGEDGGNIEQYPAGDYGQNEQYAYYEGAQQEQAYATNINEHEESTERYDPHYNEQYETSNENQQPDNTVNYSDPSLSVNLYDQQQFQEGSYDNAQYENVADYDKQDDSKLYQQQTIGHEDNIEIRENVLPPQENEMYNQQLYSEQLDAENIEQQLVTEEGYIEDAQINAGELQNDNRDESETVVNTSAVEQTTDPEA